MYKQKFIQYTNKDILNLILENFKYRFLFIFLLNFSAYSIFAYILKTFGDLSNTFVLNTFTNFSFFLNLFIILNLLYMILNGISKLLCAYVFPDVTHIVQTKLFAHALQNNAEYFQKNSPTKIMQAINAIRSSVDQILEFILLIISRGVGQIINIYMSFTIHFYFGCLTLIYLLFTILKMIIFVYFSKNEYRNFVEKNLYLADDAADTLRNMNNAISLSGTKALEINRFIENSYSAKKQIIKIECIIGIMFTLNTLLFIVIAFIAYSFAYKLFILNEIHAGHIIQYMGILIEEMSTYKLLVASLPYYFGSTQSLDAYIAILGSAVQDKNIHKKINIDSVQKIEINSTFGYSDNPMLFKNLKLTFKRGNTYGLVGASGSGKSTIASMLIGILSEYKGTLMLTDNKDNKFELSQINIDSLQKRIAIMSQSSEIFMQRSIIENIQYGLHNVSREDAIAATKKAQAYNFICTLDQQYDTIPAKSGLKLSGGQIQRILIARLLAQKDVDFIIFDEGTSALDNNTERLIKTELHKHRQATNDSAIIIIAHRLTTLEDVDIIYVFSEGKIVESGNHKELMQKENGAYRILYNRGIQ